MTIHTPHRLASESQADYRARQRRSHEAAHRGAERELATAHWRHTGRVVNLRGLGDQRRLPSSRESLRNERRKNGNLDSGQYGKALLSYFAKRQQERIAAKRRGPRDEHGAYTFVGKVFHLVGMQPLPHEVVLSTAIDGDEASYTVRRMWLAGISARRGY